MRILITGAAGMIGRKLTARLLNDGTIGSKKIAHLDLHDVVAAHAPGALAEGKGISLHSLVSDLSSPEAAAQLVARKPDIIFHLAGIVSGEAETNFDLGYAVNLDGTRALFEALRQAKLSPRVVFTSSIAVFGAPFPEVIQDDFHQTPLTSYGAQKLMSELLLSDYTRKGFFDGIGIRLPTICVRPGKPNKAASSFFSSIIREPLAGKTAILPVPKTVVHSHASPQSAVNFLIHAASLNSNLLGPHRNLTMPSVGVTVGEMMAALRDIAGEKATALIREEPDAAIWAIVKNWPTRFNPKRALDLGFKADENFHAIIQAHIDDELGGKIN